MVGGRVSEPSLCRTAGSSRHRPAATSTASPSMPRGPAGPETVREFQEKLSIGSNLGPPDQAVAPSGEGRRVRRRARLLLGGRTRIVGGSARTRAVQRGDSARCSALGPRRARSWSSSACARHQVRHRSHPPPNNSPRVWRASRPRGSHRRVRNRAKPIAARPAHATRLFVQPRIMRQAVSAVRDLRKGTDSPPLRSCSISSSLAHPAITGVIANLPSRQDRAQRANAAATSWRVAMRRASCSRERPSMPDASASGALSRRDRLANPG